MEATDLSAPQRVAASSAAERARLRVDVESAARLLAPMWPLESFIAVNPLMGLLELRFEGAVREASRWLPLTGYPSPAFMKAAYGEGRVTDADLAAVLAERHLDADQTLPALRAWLEHPEGAVGPSPGAAGELADRRRALTTYLATDAQLAAFCATFADEGASGWALGDRSGGLYHCWRAVAALDPLLRCRLRRRAARAVAALPADPEDALLEALVRLGVPAEHRVEELRRQLTRLPGWASYARWREEWAGPDCTSPPLGVLDLLAVRMSYEALLFDPTGTAPGSAPVPAEGGGPWAGIWLEAYERHYRDDILGRLSAGRGIQRDAQPEAQIVFCIDARSERLRRCLEALGPYATFGFAGFFGFPVAVAGLGDRYGTARCPVLISPRAIVRERPAPGRARAAVSHLRSRARAAAAHNAWHVAKIAPGAAFPLAEALGWWLWPAAGLRTVWPRLSRHSAPPTVLDPGAAGGLALDERILFAENALVTMGLVRDFSPLVVLCGHRGRTAANPHASALDCGACAGAPGGPSARLAAAALNEPAVRAALVERGIRVPDDTWFVAAEHNTTTDDVTILDWHLVPARHGARLAQLTSDLAEAGRRCAAERGPSLPGAPAVRDARVAVAHVARRAADWAQIRPEWGLARNAAFVVGPRSLTSGIHLEGRVFLHSYEPDLDPDGLVLESILTGPLVVAQWISAQYYFSSVAPEVFGAGDKTLHNPVGGIGVLCGEGRDLRVGLPWQSVAVGNRLYHEPMRLLTIVQAPLGRLDIVIARNTVLGQLVDGQWLHLVAESGDGTGWHTRRAGSWWPWEPAMSCGEVARWNWKA